MIGFQHLDLEADHGAADFFGDFKTDFGFVFQVIFVCVKFFLANVIAVFIVTEQIDDEMSLTGEVQGDSSHMGILFPFFQGKRIEVGKKLNEIIFFECAGGKEFVIVEEAAAVEHPPVLINIAVAFDHDILKLKLDIAH